MFKGMTNQQIADNNFVSINTVKTHLNNIFTKLGIHNKIQLLRSVI
ncbi:MAG: helix-turn-helix transcriptional regulator [Saprospiraceae bacterium]|nr:helix-turn-helix transcriptional regulator [Saprospiraceae bacterium]